MLLLLIQVIQIFYQISALNVALKLFQLVCTVILQSVVIMIPGVIDISSSYKAPAYCYNCGKPFPWTESKLNSISELLDMQDQLTEDEKQYFMSHLPIIFTETPQSEVTALKLRLLINKLPSEIGSLTKNVITDVISESIKKILFPQ